MHVDVHVDVHGEWVMLWGLQCTMYVLAILSMTESCLHAETVESMSSVGSVWYVRCMVCIVCAVYGLYGMLEFTLCCEILLLLNIVDMDR